MSIHAIAWAQKVNVPLSSNEAFVLVTLAEYANDDGSNCWPAMSTVARKCRMSRATVFRILERLEHVHHVIRKERSGKPGGGTNRYRLLVNEAAHYPAELAEGSPLDPEIEAPPNLFDGQGVYHRDTPLYPQGVASGATGGVSPCYTRGVSPRDRGVSPGATRGVSPGATQPVITRQEPSARACASAHVDEYGDAVACGADVAGCALFKIPDEIADNGRRHIDEIRERLAARRVGTDEPRPALEARVS
jgi:hypothetical protein